MKNKQQISTHTSPRLQIGTEIKRQTKKATFYFPSPNFIQTFPTPHTPPKQTLDSIYLKLRNAFSSSSSSSCLMAQQGIDKQNKIGRIKERVKTKI